MLNSERKNENTNIMPMVVFSSCIGITILGAMSLKRSRYSDIQLAYNI